MIDKKQIVAARVRLENSVSELRHLRGMERHLEAEIVEAREALDGALTAADLVPSGGPPFRIAFGLRRAIYAAVGEWWCRADVRERLLRAELGAYYHREAA